MQPRPYKSQNIYQLALYRKLCQPLGLRQALEIDCLGSNPSFFN